MPIANWYRDAPSSRVQRGAASPRPQRSRPHPLNPRRPCCSRWVRSGTSPFGEGGSVAVAQGACSSGFRSFGLGKVEPSGFRR
jgi:hypothetical protein